MTTIAAVIVICIGSIGVYAASGGTIAGKPIIEWLGITFSEEYENYKVNVEGQELTSEDATIHLTSTVCDDGFTILEFDIKLMEERDDIDSVYVSFNNKLITDEMGTYLEGLNNYSLIIDGKDYWIRPQSAQTITKISNFISCVLWKGIAETTAEYCKKGDLIGVRGRLQNRPLVNAEDTKLNSVEVVAERVTFLSSKKQD